MGGTPIAIDGSLNSGMSLPFREPAAIVPEVITDCIPGAVTHAVSDHDEYRFR